MSYVISGDAGRAMRIAARLEAGMVGINRGLVNIQISLSIIWNPTGHLSIPPNDPRSDVDKQNTFL